MLHLLQTEQLDKGGNSNFAANGFMWILISRCVASREVCRRVFLSPRRLSAAAAGA